MAGQIEKPVVPEVITDPMKGWDMELIEQD